MFWKGLRLDSVSGLKSMFYLQSIQDSFLFVNLKSVLIIVDERRQPFCRPAFFVRSGKVSDACSLE